MNAPYYKLATWDARNCCWRDGKRAFETPAEATADATAPGRYRLSHVTDSGRVDLPPFDVAGTALTPRSKRDRGRSGHPTATSLVFGKRLKGGSNA